MLQTRIFKFVVTFAIFLIIVIVTGCSTLKTISPNSINDLQKKRAVLKVHCGDTIWIVRNYVLTNKVLTGNIDRSHESVGDFSCANIYAGPLNAVKIDGDILSIPRENIGKVDYKIVDRLMIIPIFGLTVFLLLFVPLIFA